MNRALKRIIFAAVGAFIGFLYYKFIGCNSGG